LFFGALCRFGTDIDAAGGFLKNLVYNDYGDEDKDKAKEFRKFLHLKAEYAKEQLITPVVRDRLTRLKTAGSPCLEEVDVEVVKERQDSLAAETVNRPFLRIRVRYCDDGDDLGFRFFMGFADAVQPTKNFHLECDESDIDLLMRRLREAKAHLLRIQEHTEGNL
jgi:hypothetical protein